MRSLKIVSHLPEPTNSACDNLPHGDSSSDQVAWAVGAQKDEDSGSLEAAMARLQAVCDRVIGDDRGADRSTTRGVK